MIDSIGPRKADFGPMPAEKRLVTDVPMQTAGSAEASRPLTSLSHIAASSQVAGPMPFDSARVESLTRAIQEGTYVLDPERTAAAMLSSLTPSGGTSA
jgi:anti-sigma28 factor (negative regulator of flagellin synthesis)